MNQTKNLLRKKFLLERKHFDLYKYHSENELIIEKVETVINSIYYTLNTTSKKIINLTHNHVEVLQLNGGVGMYLPLKGEPDLTKLMVYNDWILSLPKIETNKIKFVYYKLGDKLEKVSPGIQQPVSDTTLTPNIIIVPALAYSIKGYRLGFGEGFYDKYFAARENNSKTSAVRIGVCFDKFLSEYLPIDKHDVKFNYIITEKTILKL